MSELTIHEFVCDICDRRIYASPRFRFNERYVCTTCFNRGILWSIRKANEEGDER